MFYRVGDWDDLRIDLHISLHAGFKIQFAGIIPIFLEFNGANYVFGGLHGGHVGGPLTREFHYMPLFVTSNMASVSFSFESHVNCTLRLSPPCM